MYCFVFVLSHLLLNSQQIQQTSAGYLTRLKDTLIEVLRTKAGWKHVPLCIKNILFFIVLCNSYQIKKKKIRHAKFSLHISNFFFFFKVKIADLIFICLMNPISYSYILYHSVWLPIKVMLENNEDKKQAGSGVQLDFLTLTTIINYLLNFKALKLVMNMVEKNKMCLFTINYLLHMFYRIRWRK